MAKELLEYITCRSTLKSGFRMEEHVPWQIAMRGGD